MKKKKGIRFSVVFALFTVVPLIIVTVILTSILFSQFKSEIKESNYNTMVTLIDGIGSSIDYSNEVTRTTLANFTSSEIVSEIIKNPADEEVNRRASDYMDKYYSNLEGWDGIYLADWNSTVLMHPVSAAIGMTLRSGDSLASLQDSMLNSDGVYDIGVLVSPASGQYATSMYVPVYDEGNPVAFVGGGVQFLPIAQKFSDVSSLGLDSAYIYYVANDGNIIYHPTEEKIGTEVENESIKTVVARMQNGEHPEASYVEYEYKGKNKVAAYYVGENNSYVAILVADENEVLSSINAMRGFAVVCVIILLVIAILLSLPISRRVTKPYKKLAAATKRMADGSFDSDIRIRTGISENIEIIQAENGLRQVLNASVNRIKKAAGNLNRSVADVENEVITNADSIDHINGTIEEVAKTSQEVSVEAHNMMGQTDNLSRSIDTLSDNIMILNDSSRAIVKSNDDATAQVKCVMDSSNEAIQAVDEISAQIAQTNDAIGEISMCLGIIEAITKQTNLLSLNASIEAAKAGEAGRGFAVVAEEIRTLAESTASNSNEIKIIIEKVERLSSDTVRAAEKVTRITNEQQGYIADTQDKFDILSSEVGRSIEQIENIKKMTETLEDIKKSLAFTTSNLGNISEELGASAEEVAASCRIVADSFVSTKDKTKDMHKLDEEVMDALSFFK